MQTFPPAAAGAQRTRGRPRQFDMDDVLDRAIHVFRRYGYHAASINELTKATGLTEGSLYKAFQGKEALFIAAFDRYCAHRQRELSAVLATKNQGAEQLHSALLYYVSSSTGAEGELGCLIVVSTSALDLFDSKVATKVRQALRRNETTLVALIEKGISDGSIRSEVDPVATAKLLWCMLMGIRVAGKAGAGRKELEMAIKQAIHLLR